MADSVIEPDASAVNMRPAVPSPTPVRSAMNGSAGPNEVTHKPTQNSPRNAAASARAASAECGAWVMRPLSRGAVADDRAACPRATARLG